MSCWVVLATAVEQVVPLREGAKADGGSVIARRCHFRAKRLIRVHRASQTTQQGLAYHTQHTFERYLGTPPQCSQSG